jgi:formamidopyrimidine-DNA glycosylase
VPELPEVEVIRRGLDQFVVGRRIADVRVLHPRAVRRHVAGPADFAARLAGRVVGGARRRGKYLWLPIGDDALVAHLGMSGQLLVGPAVAPISAHVRVRFTFADGGTDLRFTDQRTFGNLLVSELVDPGDPGGHPGGAVAEAARLPAVIAHIAPDPLEEAFDLGLLTRRMRTRRTGVKRALLDQSLVSGIGNIYADEALWRAKLHYARATDRLRPGQIVNLMGAVTDVFTAALKDGGTSFDRLYVNVNGESGYFDQSLNVYGRAGEPCPRCGTPIRRDAFMNRSAYTCPHCQPRPRSGRW